MPLWAKVDVDMPVDEKLFGQPVATRWLWLCLITLAKKQDEGGAVRGYDCLLLSGAYNIPRKAVANAMTHFQQKRMVELDADGTIRLLHFAERQGEGFGNDPMRKGYVYFIRAETTGRIKIGFSANPWARMNELQGGNSDKLEILATVKGFIFHERELHKRFDSCRHNREWFNPSEELLRHIASVATPSDADRSDEAPTLRAVDIEVDAEQSREKEDPPTSAAPQSDPPISELESDWPKDLLSRVKEAITSTRKSGMMAEGPWRAFLLSAKQFSLEIRSRASNEYLDRAFASEGKSERYLIGIMRGENSRKASAARNGAHLRVDNEKLRLEPTGRKML